MNVEHFIEKKLKFKHLKFKNLKFKKLKFKKLKFKRLLLLFFSFFLVLLIALAFISHKISEKINQNQAQIIAGLTETLKSNVQIGTIKNDWLINPFVLLLEDVTITNADIKNPDIKKPNIKNSENSESKTTAQTIKVSLEIPALLFEQKVKPKRITIVGLNTSLHWDEQKNFSIAGFNDLTIFKNLNNANTNINANLPVIELVDANILWQGPNLKVIQFLDGEFKSENDSLIVKIKQKIKVRDGKKFKSQIRLKLASNLKSGTAYFESKGLTSECKLSHFDPQSFEKNESHLDCIANINDIEIERLQKYYVSTPEDKEWLRWLKRAVIAGTIHSGNIQLDGPINNLKVQGEIDFEDVDLAYNPNWPELERAEGTITLANDRLDVELAQGSIFGVPIGAATASVKPLQKLPVITIEGNLSSHLERGLEFLKESPLKKSVAKALDPLRPEGLMKLGLKLTIPTEKNNPVKVEGVVSARMAHLTLADLNSTIEHINGDFHFTEKSLEASKITGRWWDHPILVSIETLAEASQNNHGNLMKIMATGSFSTEFLQRQLPNPLLEKMQGRSVWTVAYTTPLNMVENNNPGIWTFSSDLKGTAVHLPEPFEKEAASTQNLTVTVQEAFTKEPKVDVNFEKIANAKLNFSRKDDQLYVKRGNLVFGGGAAHWVTKDTLLIGGVVKAFNASWMDILEESNQKNIFPPVEINLLVENLEAYGLAFTNTRVISNLSTAPLEWRLDGPNIKGEIILPGAKNRVFTIDLQHLKIVASGHEESNETDFLKESNRFSVLFRCKELQYERIPLSDVIFKLWPKPYGYEIAEFNLNLRSSKLSGTGEWRIEEARSSTKLAGKIVSRSMGELISYLGFSNAVSEAAGTVQYNFNWDKNPFQFDISAIEGTAELTLNKGRIMSIDPGFGRVIGLISPKLLNPKDIPKRLALNFNDVFKKGFSFDQIKGKLEFRKGKVYTPQVLINGSAAKIEVSGTTNLKTKDVDLNVIVTLHGGVGLPIAAAVGIINPIAGLGVGLLDQFTGATSNITQQRFRVTGTWNFPSIKSANENRRRMGR